jgi:large subunit ribosomal protein L25
MRHLSVQATLRGKQSHGELARSRQEGNVPVSVSGKGMEPVSLFITAKDINRILQATNGRNTLVDISFEGGRHVARLLQVEHNSLLNRIMSVSLQKIAVGDSQKATVGVEIIGEPESVRNGLGMLATLLHELEVRALPEKMVANITIDTANMQVGDSIRAGDIVLPEGFEMLTNAEALIVSVQMSMSAAGAHKAAMAASDKELVA